MSVIDTDPKLRARRLLGLVTIEKTHTLAETARLLSQALAATFSEELSGRFEEFPAYVASAGGLEFALLAPPAPEDDTRDDPVDEYQLDIGSTHVPDLRSGQTVDVSMLFAAMLKDRTGLVCAGYEMPGTLD
jgi:hypothetical protein